MAKKWITVLVGKVCNRETLLYIVFGGLTTLVSYVSFVACSRLGLGTVAANTISTVLAVIFAFFTNKVFVFRSGNWATRAVALEFLNFCGARFVSYLVETGTLVLLVNWMGVEDYIAKIITSVIVVMLNYVFSRLIFRKNRESKG